MTYLSHDLGIIRPNEKHSAYQICTSFRTLMEAEYGRAPANAYFSRYAENGQLGLQVMYDPESHRAVQWAQQVYDDRERMWRLAENGVIARGRNGR